MNNTELYIELRKMHRRILAVVGVLVMLTLVWPAVAEVILLATVIGFLLWGIAVAGYKDGGLAYRLADKLPPGMDYPPEPELEKSRRVEDGD